MCLRAVLCKNQEKWEMKIFDPPPPPLHILHADRSLGGGGVLKNDPF